MNEELQFSGNIIENQTLYPVIGMRWRVTDRFTGAMVLEQMHLDQFGKHVWITIPTVDDNERPYP